MPNRVGRSLRWLYACLLVACVGDRNLSASGLEEDSPASASAPADAAVRASDTRTQASADAASARPADDEPAASAPAGNRPLNDTDCGGAKYVAKGKELEILVLFDNSASMLLPALSWACLTLGEGCPESTTGLAPSLWEVAVNELMTFARDARSSGISLGLKYFASECNAEAYATPDVPLGFLPMQATALQQSLAQTQLSVGTPTRPALEGALAFMQRRAAEPAYNARPLVLVVTDGVPDPLSCEDNTVQSVARVAGLGQTAATKIATYVFVTAPDLALDEIAQAGGTSKALVAELAQPGALSNAMARVRDQELAALPCEYELPPAYFSEVDDPTLVNLLRDGQPVRRLPSAADCDESGGWYYDDPGKPARILTCASTCSSLKRGGTVDIQLDCPYFVQ